MASSSLPALLGVCCAAVLALEGIALVLWSRDQHAARRRLSRAVILSAFALALTLARALTDSHAPFAQSADSKGMRTLAGSGLLYGSWVLAAFTLVEARSGVLLLAGGPFPLNLRPASADGMSASRRWPLIGELSDALVVRIVCLAVLALALSIIAFGITPPGAAVPAVAGDAGVVATAVLATDVAVAALACAQRCSRTSRAHSILAFGIALTCVALVSLCVGP